MGNLFGLKETTSVISPSSTNPRFLESKSFQVYYKHRQGTNHVIAHEMLHFVFFDYLHTKESEFNSKVAEHTIWLLSEWFNDLVLELPEFAKFRQHSKDSYPEVNEFSKQFPMFDIHTFSIEDFFRATKSQLLANTAD